MKKIILVLSVFIVFGSLFPSAGAISKSNGNDKGNGNRNPSVAVISPNGGEVLNAGQNYEIRWDYRGPEGEIVFIHLIDMAVDGGRAYSIADSVDAKQESYDWTIPVALDGTKYKIFIGSPKEGMPPIWYDLSDNYFSIFTSTLSY